MTFKGHIMLKFYRLTGVLFLFALYISGAVLLRFYAVTDVNRRRVSAWWTHKICRAGTRFMNMRIKSEGHESLKGQKGRLIISNHMSYLDILAYSAVRPAVYVSSVEMEQTPVLGFLAKIGGTYFVERRNTRNIKAELDGLSGLIKDGFDVVLFPEGTSTDGSKILPFRSSFIAGATETGVDVQPACIRYVTIDGEAFSDKNRDLVCWYGDMSFAPHFLKFLGVYRTEITTTYLPALSSVVFDRKYITKKAHELISDTYFCRPATIKDYLNFADYRV